MQNVGNCLSAAADAAAKQKCIDDFAAVDAAAAAMVSAWWPTAKRTASNRLHFGLGPALLPNALTPRWVTPAEA
jgi:hypothetical protein